ncbi:DNA methyltransferase [uncultured Roseobacter sp.]|uniref:DNA methyltransferase n=1 Tax=uncultured Roseobacter sp. TaxID=114847 RepID=UPI0026276507|nr:DNA methyltransferase [uncultured Roseobacter sp.]
MLELNKIHCGDAKDLLGSVADQSIDLVVTDPPYLVNYRDRDGRRVANDDNPNGVLPVFNPLARVMKRDSYLISFCGWSALPAFGAAWQSAGLRIVGHFVWHKPYASRTNYARYCHESAYILAKGNPKRPSRPINDVQEWVYSGNKFHPTEKAVEILTPLIRCFSKPGDTVLDPFAGSGSTCVASLLSGRQTQGFELDARHSAKASNRITGALRYIERREQSRMVA